MVMGSNLRAVVTAFAVPWNAFVGAFLYLVLVTMIVLGGASPSLAVIATAYLAPVVAYVAYVVLRLAGRVAAPSKVYVGVNRTA